MKADRVPVVSYSVQEMYSLGVLWIQLPRRLGYGEVYLSLQQDLPSRFPSLLGFVPAKKAASEIIKAMRTNQDEVSIPNGLLLLNHLLRLFPTKANHLIKDFMDSGVESHD
uniref:Uncharacterized protein n=1 Tax=Timema cristinae TaxID=61476 RepID=A0A7R9GSW0_TIMCR|nr:unnamed protein product [Timema cristinae]